MLNYLGLMTDKLIVKKSVIILFLFIFSCAQYNISRAPAQWFTKDSTIEAGKKRIEENIGRILSRDEAPIIYENLDPIFSNLRDAKKRLFGGSGVIFVEEFFVVDSTQVRAFVYQLDESGVNEQKNIVCVTTGLLELFTRVIEGEELSMANRRALLEVAGVLAHELAHPVNKLEATINSSQAEEIRADIEGSLILKEAGYPEESLLNALDTIYEGVEKKDKTVVDSLLAASSTHPERRVRSSAQRLSLTYQRYFYGANLISNEDQFQSGLREEVLTVTDFEIDGEDVFRFSDSFDESLDNLIDELTKGYLMAQEVEKKLVDLYYHINQMTSEDVSQLDQVQIEKYQKIISLTLEHDDTEKIALPSDSFTKKYTNIDFNVRELLASGHPFFEKEEFHTQFKNIYHEDFVDKAREVVNKNELREMWDRVLSTTGLFISQKKAKPVYYSDYVDFIKKTLETPPHIDYTPFAKKFVSTEYIQDIYKALFEKYKEEGRLEVLSEVLLKSEKIYDSINYSVFNPLSYLLTAYQGKVKESTFKTSNQYLQSRNQDIVKEMSSFAWKNRGAIAVSEVFRNKSSRVHWNQLFRDHNLSTKEGEKLIQEAFLDLVESEEFPQVLKTKSASFSNNGYVSIKESFLPRWVDKRVIEKLVSIYDEKYFQSGQRNEFLKKLLIPALTGHPGMMKKVYRQRLVRELSAFDSISEDDIRSALKNANEYFAIKDTYSLKALGNDLEVMLIDVLEEHKEQISDYQSVVRKLFIADQDTNSLSFSDLINPSDQKAIKWQHPGRAQSVLNVTKRLKKYGIIDYYYQSLSSVTQKGHATNALYNKIAHLLKDDLKEILELDQPKRDELLLDISKVFSEAHVKNYQHDKVDSLPIKLRKAREEFFTILIKEEKIDFKTALELFNIANYSGHSRNGDEFFLKFIYSQFENQMSDNDYQYLADILRKDNIFSVKLKAKLSKLLMDNALVDYIGESVSDSDISLILNQLNDIFPEQTGERDELLEQIAWKLDIRDPSQLNLVESYKSSNWQRIDPKLVNKASLLSEELSNMDSKNVELLIQYILDPKDEPMPRAIEQWLIRHLSEKFEKTSMKADVIDLVQERMFVLKDIIEVKIAQAKPMEKIPFVEMLLNLGDDPIMSEDYFRVFCRLMNRSENDPNNKVLKAFLNSIPPHEISTTLSYLMVNDGQGSAAIKSTFEAFGPVGKKAAQMASIWELLDSHLNEQLEDLKDNAKPLSKAEIETILRDTLTDEDYSRIKRVKRVVGSASIKTVVEVELVDGQVVVGMLQSPQAANLIESNIVFAKKFLEALASENVEYDANVIAGMVKDVETQLHLELDMIREAKKIEEASTYYQQYNKKFNRSEWKINVPSVIEGFSPYKNVLFVQKADGVSFDKLSAQSQLSAGQTTVHSSVYGIFNDGWFDKDRHKGNFFFDEESKTIHVIDFGQATKLENNNSLFKLDDRFILSELFRGIDSRNEKVISSSLATMSKKEMSQADIKSLTVKIQKLLASDLPMKSFMAKMINLMPEIGFPLEEKYSFETLKALMILYGENYVSEEKFSLIMKDLIRSTYLRKPVRSCKMLINNFF